VILKGGYGVPLEHGITIAVKKGCDFGIVNVKVKVNL
jgi:hypothetical protein